MTNYRKLVGILDPNWRLEAVLFDMNEQGLTLAYPSWFIDLLVNQEARGHSIQFSSRLATWFLRNPNGPDWVLLDKECYITRNPYGDIGVVNRLVFENNFIGNQVRDWVEGVDS